LPVFLTVTVSNQTKETVYANSVGEGSVWVVPSRITREDGVEVAIDDGASTVWRTSVALGPYQVMTGRIDVGFFASGGTDGGGLPAGRYTIILSYRPATNSQDRITSPPVLVTVMNPTKDQSDARTILHDVRRILQSADRTLPDGLLVANGDTRNLYWVASRVHIGRWLSRRKRFDEAISIWKDLLAVRNEACDLYRVEAEIELAQCFMLLKEKTKARELLEPIKDRSDVAYGLLHILAGSSE
jgi:hypothetical protein